MGYFILILVLALGFSIGYLFGRRRKMNRKVVIAIIAILSFAILFKIAVFDNVNLLCQIAGGLNDPSTLYYFTIERIYKIAQKRDIRKHLIEDIITGKNGHLHYLYMRILGVIGENDAISCLMKIYIDGRFVSRKEAKISIFDHGFLYGDGVFEGIRVYKGRIFRLKQHIDRLYQSAKGILLTIPLSPQDLEKVAIKTMRDNRLKDAYIRLIISRGEGDLGLDPRKCFKPSIICIVHKIELYPEEIYKKGLALITLSTIRNAPQALNAQIKSLNYLNNILAKIEATTSGADEGIMLNEKGYVTECTGENIFIVQENKLITPPCYLGALKGITRQIVLELGESSGLKAEEKIFTRYDLYNSSECFLTGTAAEIVPVVSIDSRKIGKGVPGSITKNLRKRFRDLTHREGVEVYGK